MWDCGGVMAEYVAVEMDIPYVGEDATTGEVALKLEKKYKLAERFYNFIAPQLGDRLERYLVSSKMDIETAIFKLNEWLKGEWLEYMRMEMHGIKTQASINREGLSFIYTGNYVSNMMPRINL